MYWITEMFLSFYMAIFIIGTVFGLNIIRKHGIRALGRWVVEEMRPDKNLKESLEVRQSRALR